MAFPETQCATCPIGPGRRCHSQRARAAFACDPKYREWVLRRTAEDAGESWPEAEPAATLPALPWLDPPPAPPLVLYLLNSWGIAGGVRILHEHLNGLADRGHDVGLVTIGGGRPDPAWHPARFPVESLAEAKASGLWARADTIVATHWTTAEEVAKSPARQRLYYVQGREDAFPFDQAEAEAARATYALPLRPLATSRWVKRFLEDEFGHRNVPVIPQGVDCEAWHPDPDPWPRAGGRLRVLITGHTGAKCKNVADAYAAAERLRARGLDIEVWAFSQMMHVGHRPDRFWLSPDQATIRRIYSSCDLLLCSSRLEGRTLIFDESLACGLPVVTMDCKGTDNLDGFGIVTPPGDVAALADAAARLLADPLRRATMAAQGLVHARRDLRWSAALDALEGLYGLSGPARRGTLAVAVPTYDRPDKVGRALDSLLAQTRGDWRCIVVVNGGVRDEDYRAALAPYAGDPRVTIRFIPEAGIPGALNAALAEVESDYLSVLEDDDAWHPEFLEMLARPLDLDPGCTLAYCDSEEYWDEDPPRPTEPRLIKPPDETGYAYRRDVHLKANWICYPVQMLRVASLRRAGGFHPEAGGCSDWDTGLRLSGMGRVRHVRRTLARHYWHDANTCQQKDAMAPGVEHVKRTEAGGGYRPGTRPRPDPAARLALVHQCDYRGGPIHGTAGACGCQGRVNLCGLGRGRSHADGRHIVASDCLECVGAGAGD